jgi:hypothetical protein
MYCVTVLEAESLRSRCGQGWFLVRGVMQTLCFISFLQLVIITVLGITNASPQSLPSSPHGSIFFSFLLLLLLLLLAV